MILTIIFIILLLQNGMSEMVIITKSHKPESNYFRLNKGYSLEKSTYNSMTFWIRVFGHRNGNISRETFLSFYTSTYDYTFTLCVMAFLFAQWFLMLSIFNCCFCLNSQKEKPFCNVLIGAWSFVWGTIYACEILFKVTSNQQKIPMFARDVRFCACAHSSLIIFNLLAFITHFNKFRSFMRCVTIFFLLTSLGIILCAAVLLCYDISDIMAIK